ncbi:MAG: flagellar M-ring protein FliF C-terminal domain-containing protein, partial [Rubrivivax sp.]|nr:flagellar M-ring protein FliF C-terminal domain-containing protein [Rubrivivax sp.]
QVLQAGAGAVAGAAARREAATRFEVDKTVTVTRNAAGAVRRLSAAVVVNHRTGTDAKGKATATPLTEGEIEQLTALVQQGIGFDAQRGDVVKVINAPFRVEAIAPADVPPLWQQPWLMDMLRSAAAPFALALVALMIVFSLIRPALKSLLAPPPARAPGSRIDEVVDGDPALPGTAGALPALAAPLRQADRIEAARALARQNPAAMAQVVRGWVNGEAA